MAAIKGNSGKVKVGATFVAEVTKFSLKHSAAMVESSKLTDPTDKFLAGSDNWSGTLTAHWDPSDTLGQEALAVGASVTIWVEPAGSGAGSTYYTGTALVSEMGVDVARNAMVDRQISFQGSDTLTQGTL